METMQITSNEKRTAAISALAAAISALIPIVDKDFKYLGLFLGGLNVFLLIFAASGKLDEWTGIKKTQIYLVLALVTLSLGTMSIAIIHSLHKPAIPITPTTMTPKPSTSNSTVNNAHDQNIVSGDGSVINTGIAGDISINSTTTRDDSKTGKRP